MLIDVEKFLEALEDGGTDVCEDCYDYAEFGYSRKAIRAAINRVNQEMSAREYIHISNRMMKEDYRAWDMLMVFEGNDDADKALAWVEEWARKHPEGSEE